MKKESILIVIILCLLSIIWLYGCGSVPPTYYYTFRPDVEKKVGTVSPKYPYVLAIEAFEADVPYDQDKIVFRTSPYQVNFYEYHKWLRPPAELVSDQVLKLVSAAGLFQGVHTKPFDSYADYILRGRIKMFDQWYSETSSLVRIQLEYALMASEKEQILWMDTVETTVPISHLKVVETVKGFETALQENVLQVLAAIDRVLSQRK